MLYLSNKEVAISLSCEAQKGTVYGHIPSQNVSRCQSRLDLINVSVELVNCGCAFGVSLSTGKLRWQSFDSNYLSATATLLLIFRTSGRLTKRPA